MDMSDERRIAAPREKVWEALNDPEVLKISIPGCETVEKKSDTEFTARVQMAVGPVKAKFSGEVTLTDVDPPNGYTLTGQGSGGAAGFGKGEAKVSLTSDGNDTILSYTAHASVGGKLAQIGQRLVDSASKKLADQFFTNFANHVAAAESGPPAAAGAEAPAPAPAAPAQARTEGGAMFWIVTALALVALWIIYH
jgi:carbon monoxide dehydrogenase subunit G